MRVDSSRRAERACVSLIEFHLLGKSRNRKLGKSTPVTAAFISSGAKGYFQGRGAKLTELR